MTEYWFYHMEASTLESVLPELLEKTRGRGWKALLKLPASRLASLDEYLWTFQDASFLPHGRDDEALADQQPVLLTAERTSSDGFECVFLIEGQDIDCAAMTVRCIVLINGRSQEKVAQARQLWKKLKDTGAVLSYWQQSERGRWEKKA